MRTLDRDRRWILVARFEGIEAAIDDEGRYTGQNMPKRSPQAPLLASVSAAKGTAENSQFGQSLDYDRTVIIEDPDYPIDEAAVLWIDSCVYGTLLEKGFFDGIESDEYVGEPHDYLVKKVARTANYTVLAVKHVEVSA